jgi:hypothetical protein
VFERGVELTADRFPEPDPVPLITRRRGGEVAIAVRRVGNLLRQALAIVRKAAAGEDYGAGMNLNIAIIAAQYRAADPTR